MIKKTTHILKYDTQTYNITIEQNPFILNGSIQAVYKYYIDDKEILIYYTNGLDTNLYPVYYDIVNFPKTILDVLLKNYLPITNL